MSGNLRVIFFGNSQSVFSNRFFSPILKAPCDLVGLVDMPREKRLSTNPWVDIDHPGFDGMGHDLGIPVFESLDPNTPSFIETLAALTPDLFLAAGYMFRLKPGLLSIPRIMAINLHASLLPAYRGRHPVFWALRNGERQTGLTAHVMDPHFDTGDILYQVRVRTRQADTVSTLYDRIIEKSLSLVPRIIDDAHQGKFHRRPQSESGSSYFSSARVEDFQVDWTLPAEVLQRWIKTSPGECWREVAGRRLFFMDAKVIHTPDSTPGILIRLGRNTATVAVGRNALRLHWAHFEGEDKLSLSHLCATNGLMLGSSL